jgi:hypothetical protein
MGYFCGPQATPRHAAPSTPHPPYLPPIYSAIVFPTTVMNIKTLAYLGSCGTRIHAYGSALSRNSIKPTGHTQRRTLFCPSLLSFLPSTINRHLWVECGNEMSWTSVWFYKIQAIAQVQTHVSTSVQPSGKQEPRFFFLSFARSFHLFRHLPQARNPTRHLR